MKKQIKYLKLYFPFLIVLTAFSGITQGTITHIALRENRSGNGDCSMLDIPQILGNPKALLFITQKESGLNPHPIGAYYFKNRWNIMNLDQAGMPDYAKFNVEYFINPDNDHFQYVIKKEDIRKDGSAILNHPALNDHPDSKFEIFHTWVPESKEYGNREATSIQYYPGLNRWVLKNVNNKALTANVAYNIAVSFHGNAVSNPITTNPVTTPVTTTPVTTTPVTTTPVNTTPVTTTPVNTTPVNTNPTTTAATGNSGSGPIGGNLMYMTVWENGIKLPGESLRKDHFDKIEVVDFEMGVARAADAATGLSSGRKMYELITIKKLTGGAATIPYFNAFIKDPTLVVTIETYSNNITTGAVELNYTLKLSGAHFMSFRQTLDEGNAIRTVGYVDVIKISFTKIEFIKDGVSVSDQL